MVLWFFFTDVLWIPQTAFEKTIYSSHNLSGKFWACHLMDTNSSEPKIGAADNLPILPSWSCSCHVPWVPRHWVVLVSSRCSTKPQMPSAKWPSRWMNQTLWVALCLLPSPTPQAYRSEPLRSPEISEIRKFFYNLVPFWKTTAKERLHCTYRSNLIKALGFCVSVVWREAPGGRVWGAALTETACCCRNSSQP